MKITVRHVHEFGPGASTVLGLLADRLHSIIHQGNQIMSKIADFAAKQDAHNASMKDDFATVKQKIDEQTALITQLQNSAGEISADDQATLDRLEQNAGELQTAADSLAGKVENPPAPPADTTDQPAP